jgi:hypothetical protein
MSDHGFPRFDGKGNAQTWLSTFRFSLADAALLDERFAAPAVQVARLCSHLDGDAALWRDTALAARNGQLWENVDQFAVAFLAAHIAVNDRQSARDELWSCEQGNDKVKDYVVRFNRVIARIPGITRDDEALDRFIHGLSRTGVWRVVRIANPQTLQAAMTEAQLADDRASHSRRDVLDRPTLQQQQTATKGAALVTQSLWTWACSPPCWQGWASSPSASTAASPATSGRTAATSTRCGASSAARRSMERTIARSTLCSARAAGTSVLQP